MKLNSFRLRIVFAVMIASALSAFALAHTHLEKTEPADGAVLTAAPSHVELWFNEKPDLTVSKITVAGSSGAVAVGPTHSMSDKSMMADIKTHLSDGNYVVSWQAAGDDGHVSKGEFKFSVKAAH
jgi:methionine-rich copper-binding protein CopC